MKIFFYAITLFFTCNKLVSQENKAIKYGSRPIISVVTQRDSIVSVVSKQPISQEEKAKIVNKVMDQKLNEFYEVYDNEQIEQSLIRLVQDKESEIEFLRGRIKSLESQIKSQDNSGIGSTSSPLNILPANFPSFDLSASDKDKAETLEDAIVKICNKRADGADMLQVITDAEKRIKPGSSYYYKLYKYRLQMVCVLLTTK